jgi:hypothetical protein
MKTVSFLFSDDIQIDIINVGMQIGLAFMLSLLIGPMITINLGISGLFWVIAGLSIVALIIVTTLITVSLVSRHSNCLLSQWQQCCFLPAVLA